ncbi:MAG TPA: D-tyrosyl-tRNA(Tyr) deacylase, partial [Firmicutes bacterium]|nr:D-tyrosyl-tRNA(Tyr) deacylase [Bacillota bacterium]
MRAVLQRVKMAQVDVDGQIVGRIGRGLLVFVGALQGDTEEDVRFIGRKLASIRLFPDDAGKMNLSVSE